MSDGKLHFLTQSQASSSQSNAAAVTASVLTIGADAEYESQEQLKEILNEKLRTMRDNLKANEDGRFKLSTEYSIKQQIMENSCPTEQAVKLLKEEEEHWKTKIEEGQALRISLLKQFEKDANVVAKVFFDAPGNFTPEKIQEDILQYNSQVDEKEIYIHDELDPKIKTSEDVMAHEPVCVFEYPGLLPDKLTAKDLSLLVCKLKEARESTNQSIAEVLKDIQALEEEENSI